MMGGFAYVKNYGLRFFISNVTIQNQLLRKDEIRMT